ncbi:IS630 family transposase [Salinibacter ruber]|uniref:IS630 family transposase n=1 Tax=Salinibacter ruber TaxID=146919 RepID=UPI002167DA1A|nr:IS630 family transposase [Salinibacter ruber]MCS4055891.1 transposase [Salinibacter ruber]
MDLDPSDWREARRFRAYKLKQKGWQQTDIAEALGVSEGAVSQWMNKAREGGKEALKTSPRPGRPPKLSEKQRTEELPSLLEEGPERFGFRGEVWTRKRVRTVIKEEFGVEYDVSQVGRILDQIGWSRQKPDHRSNRRDEQATKEWKEEEWPRIKKSRD